MGQTHTWDRHTDMGQTHTHMGQTHIGQIYAKTFLFVHQSPQKYFVLKSVEKWRCGGYGQTNRMTETVLYYIDS